MKGNQTNNVLSQLLKKSFEIIDESSRGDTSKTLSRTGEILDILREHKKNSNNNNNNNNFAATKKSLSAAEFFRDRQSKPLHKYEDPFEVLAATKPKIKPKLSEQPPRKMKKSSEKYCSQEIDYGEQQKQLQKKKNAKIIKAMLWLGGSLVLIALIGEYL